VGLYPRPVRGGSAAFGLTPRELVSRFVIGWRLADYVDKDFIDARSQLLDPTGNCALGGLAAGAAVNPITNPLGISEPRH
jgi:hypothetical protein